MHIIFDIYICHLCTYSNANPLGPDPNQPITKRLEMAKSNALTMAFLDRRKQSDLARVYPCFLMRGETPMDPTAANGQLLKWLYPIEFLIAFHIIFSANAAFIATHES